MVEVLYVIYKEKSQTVNRNFLALQLMLLVTSFVAGARRLNKAILFHKVEL